jgi:uncharacterized protein YpmB
MWKTTSCIKKIHEIAINMETNTMKYQIMFLEQNRQKNYQVLSFYTNYKI